MAKSKNKTCPTDASVDDFLASVEHAGRREDAQVVLEMMERLSGEKPEMWGPSIVGFGRYRYRYDSGREGDWFLCGFAPRKANLVVYVMGGFEPHAKLLERLGKYRTGKSCLYLNRLESIDLKVLEKLVQASMRHVERNHAG